MKIFIILALFGISWAAYTMIGRAPFCKVSKDGMTARCYYYSLAACERSIISPGPFCIWKYK